MQAVDAVTSAERGQKLRARVLPMLGTALIVVNALTVGVPGWGAKAIWLSVIVAGFVLVQTGGYSPARIRDLMNDETSRANRQKAIGVGYCGAIASGVGLSIVAALQPVAAGQAIQIVLVTAVSAPLISFGALERRALGG
jgi:hypothetical protein